MAVEIPASEGLVGYNPAVPWEVYVKVLLRENNKYEDIPDIAVIHNLINTGKNRETGGVRVVFVPDS